MIIEFSVKNYLSIKEKQTFSLIPNKATELAENIYNLQENVNFGILKSAVIYGANAAGKTNFLLAFDSMVDIIHTSSSKSQAGDNLRIKSFKLSSDTIAQPSEFEIIFIANKIRYQYGFSATEKQIIEEWLFAFPKGRTQKWFHRTWDEKKSEFDWVFGSSLLGEKQLWQKATRSNALFLSTAVQLNSEQLKPIFTWFRKNIRVSVVSEWLDTYSAKYCIDKSKSKVLSFLKSADLGIDDIVIEKEKFDPNKIPDELPKGIKDMIISDMKDKYIYDIFTVHLNDKQEPIKFSFKEESNGTNKLFALAGPWLDALEHGYTLIIDELSNALHSKLISHLIKLFHDPNFNKNGAQLIFSTHETSILNQNIFRRDQIWFCEKNEKNATTLFPLTDYHPRKGRENLEASYLDGRYGALPFIKEME